MEEDGLSNQLLLSFVAICSPHLIQQLAAANMIDCALLMQEINEKNALPVQKMLKEIYKLTVKSWLSLGLLPISPSLHNHLFWLSSVLVNPDFIASDNLIKPCCKPLRDLQTYQLLICGQKARDPSSTLYGTVSCLWWLLDSSHNLFRPVLQFWILMLIIFKNVLN